MSSTSRYSNPIKPQPILNEPKFFHNLKKSKEKTNTKWKGSSKARYKKLDDKYEGAVRLPENYTSWSSGSDTPMTNVPGNLANISRMPLNSSRNSIGTIQIPQSSKNKFNQERTLLEAKVCIKGRPSYQKSWDETRAGRELLLYS